MNVSEPKKNAVSFAPGTTKPPSVEESREPQSCKAPSDSYLQGNKRRRYQRRGSKSANLLLAAMVVRNSEQADKAQFDLDESARQIAADKASFLAMVTKIRTCMDIHDHEIRSCKRKVPIGGFRH